jgi:hypothetical protein
MKMSLIDRAFETLNDFQFRVMKRRAAFQPRPNRVLSFRNPENSQERRAIPTFGAEPGAFGEDWASYRLPKTRPVGPLPIEHENIHGYVNPNSERPLPVQEAYVDPAISHVHKRTSEGTDQRPAGLGHDALPMDKEIVLHTGSRKCLESDVGKSPREPTLGDQAARDLKKWDFDFSF